ncbi:MULTISPECIES: hypothetical protein [Nostocaceae]|uniref:hypothetical protein n=1 Tax=Nostocaceae TaxID=1162 RepID=UPI0037BFF9E8
MERYNRRSRSSINALPASKNALSTLRSKCRRCLRQAALRLRVVHPRLVLEFQRRERQSLR